MFRDVLPNHNEHAVAKCERSVPQTRQAQQAIYDFLLDIVKRWTPEAVLPEFKRLFFGQVDRAPSIALDAVYELVWANDQVEFCYTLKRCCYILVNNWDATRQISAIKDLVAAFDAHTLCGDTASLTLTRLQHWVEAFKQSQDFDDLRLFVARYDRQAEDAPWSNRFTSYLLVSQYANQENPVEQREAARALAQHLRQQFKLDLAMYVARSQVAKATEYPPENPTALGDDALRLIKTVVAKHGRYSYVSLANIFLKQVCDISFAAFKQSLHRYLVFSVSAEQPAPAVVTTLKSQLAEKLDTLYEDYASQRLNDALMLRTCNRVIDWLTTENRQEPSALFVLLLSQGNPMTLAVKLLKLVLISPNSRLHLESRIAELIRYYEKLPEDDCHWVIRFLEIFNVTFTIYAENVEYNLIKMEPKLGSRQSWQDEIANLDAYRVFSQLRLMIQPQPADVATAVALEEGTVEILPSVPLTDDRAAVSSRLPQVASGVDEVITVAQAD
jgi:hypothetical protein